SVQDKKTFIQWFLSHYQLKKRESVWILNYLIDHSKILAHVHFVRDVKFCPRGIMMSTYCSKEAPFRFYKIQLVTTDTQDAFNDIRLNRKELLYIQLNCNNEHLNTVYEYHLEENPFVPETYFITKKDRKTASALLYKLLYEHKMKSLQ